MNKNESWRGSGGHSKREGNTQIHRYSEREREGGGRNLHVDQAYPVAQEAPALLVDPAQEKEKGRGGRLIFQMLQLIPFYIHYSKLFFKFTQLPKYCIH